MSTKIYLTEKSKFDRGNRIILYICVNLQEKKPYNLTNIRIDRKIILKKKNGLSGVIE